MQINRHIIKILFTIAVVAINVASKAQVTNIDVGCVDNFKQVDTIYEFCSDPDPSFEQPPFHIIDKMPEFEGGEKALYKFVHDNIIYPELAWDNDIHGTVYVQFVIDEKGKVTNPKLIRGVCPPLDNEALRVVSLIPDFKPGSYYGKPAKVFYTLGVHFSLER